MGIQKILKPIFGILFLGIFLGPLQAQWETLVFPGIGEPFPEIEGLAFFDSENGVGVGKDGVIIKITDAGSQWDTVYYNPDYQFEAVVVTHNATAFAVGHKSPLPPCGTGTNDGIVAKTKDGGNTWTISFTKEGLWSLDFPTRQVGYAGSDCRQVYKTINGGDSWDLLTPNPGPESYAISIDFVDTEIGFASFSELSPLQSALLKTTNGGLNWVDISPAGYTSLYGEVYFYDSQFGYFSVANDLIVTTNGGTNWTTLYDNDAATTFYAPFDPNLIYTAPTNFPNMERLFADGSPSVLQSSSPPSVGVMANTVFFADGLTYAAADGRLYRTYNSGQPVNYQYLQGNIYYDENLDCDFAVGEPLLHNWLVKATDSDNQSFWATSDSFGNYSMRLELENYTIQVIPANENWETCQVISSLSLNNPFDTSFLDFPMQPLFTCPQVKIDIASAELLRCQTNRSFLTYHNGGTATAEEAYVLLEMDEALQITDSSIPFSNPAPQQYRFDLDDIPQQTGDSFWVDTYLDCTNTFQGETFCMTARIFPDTICIPPSGFWDGSSYTVDASCQNDSLAFVVKNEGIDGPFGPTRYVIIEDDVLIFKAEIQVALGEDSTLTYIPSGSTLRLEVEQSPFHPGNSFPSISVEGCGLNSSDSISLGFVSLFPEDDNDFFVATQCHESYDAPPSTPLDAFPKGYGPQHLVPPHTELDYLVRIQNSSPDTVYQIIVYDTLSPFLDPGSIQWGGSSHDYVPELLGSGVLKITFPNIQLPPETINSKTSKAFVKFRVAQIPGNAPGTIIENQVSISMDFGDLVNSNLTFHQIAIDFLPPLEEMSIMGNVQNIIGLPIPSVNLEIPHVDRNTQTDALGQYEFPMLPVYQQYTLAAAYEAPSRIGVSAQDLYLLAAGIQEDTVWNQTYWPAVSDVDRNGKINDDDLMLLEQFILGNTTRSTDLGKWFFQPTQQSLLLANPPNNHIPINNPTASNGMPITGLLNGDLNGDYLREDFDGELGLRFFTQQDEGQQFSTQVLLDQQVEIQSCQFTLVFDPTQQKILDLQSPLAQQNNQGRWGYHSPEPGKITFFWYALDAKVLAETRFPLLTVSFTGSTNNILRLAEAPTFAEAYVIDPTTQSLIRQKPTYISNLQLGAEVLSIQVSPIPAQQQNINIQFGLKEAGELSMSLFDASGKHVFEFYQEEFFEPGIYEIQLPTARFSSGSYFLRSSFGDLQKVVELMVFD